MRKVTDLLPTEAILISSDADLKVLDEFEKAGVMWGSGSLPNKWNPKIIPYVLTRFNNDGESGLFWESLDDAMTDNLTIYPATEFIPTESDEVEEGSTIESVFKLAKWILENRVSSLIDADISQEDKDRIARHFGYSADLTNP